MIRKKAQCSYRWGRQTTGAEEFGQKGGRTTTKPIKSAGSQNQESCSPLFLLLFIVFCGLLSNETSRNKPGVIPIVQ